MKRDRLFAIFVVFLAVAGMAIGDQDFALGEEQASPEATPITSCTIWRMEVGASGGAVGDTCTYSDPWWTVWDTCDITPVHAERIDFPPPHDSQLNFLPWIAAESDSVTLRGYLFYGNRPLAAGGHFDRDAMNAKLLWEFGERVELQSITGVNLWNTAQTTSMPFSVANSNDAVSYWFPSIMDFPTGGCWEATLVGVKEDGSAFSATVIFIVIDQ